MASLNIDDPRAAELAARLARITGEGLSEAVIRSLEARISRYESAGEDSGLYDRLMKLTEGPIPVVDSRSDEEILGYGESGAS
jgi:antitoxin VapB